MIERTPQDGNPNAVDTGAPVPVSVDFVEGQLNELWRDVAEAARGQGGVQAVTTAHVLNLIVRAESEKAANEYLKSVQHITGLHPCRVIAMTADVAEQDMPVQAWVSIHCQLPPTGGRQVCCEQVSVVACGSAVRQIPAAVIPLLIPDLPVFLWWPHGAPFDDYLFKNLADSTNRLIVDSSTFENPEGTLAKMHGRLRDTWPKIFCTDMSWSRLTEWREMIAQFFDPATVRPYLDEISQVTIDYAVSQRGGANRAHALLLAGWLASRLGWEPVAPTYELVTPDGDPSAPPSVHLSLREGKRSITIMLNANSEWKSETPGEIIGVKLEVPGEGQGAQPKALFSIQCSNKADECAWMEMQIEGTNPVRRPLQLETPDLDLLLDIELEVFGRDRVYEEALEMASVFIRGVEFHPRSIQPPRRIVTGEPMSMGTTKQRPTSRVQEQEQGPGPAPAQPTPPMAANDGQPLPPAPPPASQRQ